MHARFLFIILSSALCSAAYNKSTTILNGTTFKTGLWTAQEESVVLNAYKEMQTEDLHSRPKWTELSRLVGRKPSHVRYHFKFAAEPSTMRSLNSFHRWTEQENNIIRTTVTDNINMNHITNWTELASRLNRSRASTYMQYKLHIRKSHQQDYQDDTPLSSHPVYNRRWSKQEEDAIRALARNVSTRCSMHAWDSLAQDLGRSSHSVYIRYKRIVDAPRRCESRYHPGLRNRRWTWEEENKIRKTAQGLKNLYTPSAWGALEVKLGRSQHSVYIRYRRLRLLSNMKLDADRMEQILLRDREEINDLLPSSDSSSIVDSMGSGPSFYENDINEDDWDMDDEYRLDEELMGVQFNASVNEMLDGEDFDLDTEYNAF